MARIREITAFFLQDQERLNLLLEASAKAESEERAQKLYMAFRTGLKRHIQWEERLLYPVYEQVRSGLHLSPTGALLADHRKLVSLMDEALVYDFPARAPQINALKALLNPHNQREARMIYPTVDSHSEGDARDALLDELYRELALAQDLNLVS